MLNLDQITFSVKTDELDLAAKKIEALGTSLSSLTGSLTKLEKESAQAAKTQAEANLINAKAEAIADKVVKANEQQVKSTEAVTEATRKRQSVEERQAAITRIMSEGFSRGQSSILATAEALGEATERTAEYLKTQRAMQGVSPFDKSLGAATVFTNELRVMTIANDLYAKGLGFTSTQLQELGREHVRLTEQFKVQGKDLKGLDAEFNNIVTSAKQVTDAENAMALSMKQTDKATNDAGKANNFLAREMQRVDSVLTGFNDNLNVTSSNRLMKFREQLKLSGTDAATAASMLKVYEEKLKTINAVGQSKAKNSREEELRYLARATSVQLGDIGISLAGGQNPLLVLIQQGDQLRGVLNQVSANGQEMQRALSMAFSQIVNGSKDVVMALGSFVVGAFTDSGRAVARFGADILGVSGAIERLKAAKFAEWAAEGEAGFSKISKAMRASELAVSALGVGIGAFAAIAVAASVALLQITNANDKLSTSLVATGAQFGFTTEYAQDLATVLSGIGATRVDVLNTFSEISKSGNIASESFLQVAEAALTIERVGGPAVKDTVKLFGELKEKSVETLSKYAEQTGLVTAAQIAYVAELVEAGKEISATTEATNILTAAIKEQADITYASLSSMGRLWVDLKTGMNDAWGSLQDFVSGTGLIDAMAWAAGRLAAVWLEISFSLGEGRRNLASFAATSIALVKDAANLDTDFSEYKKVRLAVNELDKERQDAHDKQIRRLKQEGEFSTENLKKEAQAAADLRKKNSEAASASIELAKVNKLIKDEAEKNDSKTLTKQQFINKAIEDKNKLLREGSNLSKEQLASIEKTASIEWDKANKPKKVPKSAEIKDAEALVKWYDKSLERIKDLENATTGQVEQLTKAQILLKDLGDDKEFKKLTPELQKIITTRLEELAIKEKDLTLEKEIAKVAKEKAKVEEDLSKVRDDNSKFLNREQAEIEKSAKSSKMKLELLGKTADEQFAITEQYRLQNQLAEIGLRYDERRTKLKHDFTKLYSLPSADIGKLEKEYEEALASVNEQQLKAVDSAMQGSANAFEVRYLEKILNIGKTLSDAITTALFEGGQAGTKKLKDYIVSVFREKINVEINAVVGGMLTSVFGGGSSTGGAAGGSGGASNLLSTGSSLYNYGKTAVGAVGGWLGYGGATAAATPAAGSAFTGAASNAAFSSASGAGAGASAGFAGIPVVGWIMMGMMASGEAYNKGFKYGNKGGEGYTVSDGGLIGPNGMVGGIDRILQGIGIDPETAAILSGSALGAQGMYSLLGGYKVSNVGGGLSGTLSTSGSSLQKRTDYTQDHRGFLGIGSYTTHNSEYSDADIGVSTYFNTGLKTVVSSVKKFAGVLGLSVDKIDGYTKTIDISLDGLKPEEQQAAIDKAITGFSDGLITSSFGTSITSLSKEGETASQTMMRLGADLQAIKSGFATLGVDVSNLSLTTIDGIHGVIDELVVVDSVFNTLGYTLFEVSAAGGAAAAGLAQAFGGLQNFQAQTAALFQNYYTPAEQREATFQSVADELKAAGITGFSAADISGATREQIRTVVDTYATKVGTTEGDRQYAAIVAGANKLSPFVADFADPNKKPEAPYQEHGSSGGGGGAGDRAADSIANAWQQIVDSIWGEVKRIRDLIRGTGKDALSLAKDEFEKATALARGGDQEAAKAIPKLSQTLLTLAQGQASTLIELRRAQALTSNSMEQTVTQLANNYGLTVPAFAGGGSYGGGMALVGEQGPELINFNQGGYVHNAGQTASMLGGSDELISEIRRLNKKVEDLEAAAISTAVSNTKLLKLFERVTPNGVSIEISGTVTAI